MREFLQLNESRPGCWVYPSPQDRDGYAFYTENQRPTRAHRRAFEITHGNIPRGLYVLHSCDNPPCCNPAHLFVGTAADNARDAMKKDRHSRGERNGISKLTAAQVLAIRSDKRAQIEIAADYGIRQTTVSEIKRGNRWAHIK